jgi:hypothetical protein
MDKQLSKEESELLKISAVNIYAGTALTIIATTQMLITVRWF